jgi:hypothetical protein
MKNLIVYRPSAAAVAKNLARGGPTLPTEIHVHPSGLSVTLYADGRRVDFPTTYGVLNALNLVEFDLEQIA